MSRLFIVGDNLIGDYLIQTPAIRELRAKYPDRKICYVTSDNCVSRPLIENNPNIDKIYNLAEARVLGTKKDTVIQANCSGAHAIAVNKSCTMAEGFGDMFGVKVNSLYYDLIVPKENDDWAKAQNLGRYVVCARHSRSCTSNDPNIQAPNKCFPNSVWVEYAQWLLLGGITPVAVGAPVDEHDPAYSEWPGIKVYDQSLMNIAALCAEAELTVSVDTGIRHMAAAVGGNLLTVSCAIPLSHIRCTKLPSIFGDDDEPGAQHIKELVIPVPQVTSQELITNTEVIFEFDSTDKV